MIINSAKYSCAAGHDINEDSCLCSTERGIFIVADGLGGHSDGEKASLAAVDYFEDNYHGGCNNELISQLLEGANTEVLQKGEGGKTTVAAAFAENGLFHYANAGDSRVYYFRDGRIIAQTKDHSVCQASVDMGMIRFEDIRGNEDRSRLLKVLGSEEKLNIKKSYSPIKIQNGDAFLICSDGFWEYVYETEMEADLLKSENSEVWLKYMLKRHILRAENKGDNYTAVCGMIYLDGSENFELSDGGTVQDIPDGDIKSYRPLIIAGAALLAAVVIFAAVLNKTGSNDNDRGNITSEETSVITTEIRSVTSDTTEKAEETEKTTSETEEETEAEPANAEIAEEPEEPENEEIAEEPEEPENEEIAEEPAAEPEGPENAEIPEGPEEEAEMPENAEGPEAEAEEKSDEETNAEEEITAPEDDEYKQDGIENDPQI